MMRIQLASDTDFDGWRAHARSLVARDVPAEDVHWSVDGSASLLDDCAADGPEQGHALNETLPPHALKVPREFISLARTVILHASPDRFAVLYKVLRRLKDEHPLLTNDFDPDVLRLRKFERQVRHDEHRMHAYVRFRKIESEHGAEFVAWYEPEHHIVEATAPFFVRRFAGQRWAILTHERSLHWDGAHLAFGEGVPQFSATNEDSLEALWRAYYASIFNPARVNIKVTQGHMPRKFWSQLPEAELIGSLVAAAKTRAGQMVATDATAPRRSRPPRSPFAPSEPSVDAGAGEEQRKLLNDCRNCPLWRDATQSVPGEGPRTARLMMVGEQPGDHEDLAGRPFVGPAGKLFDRALNDAGIDRAGVYVTNAVKHFKYELRGKRRLHKTPAELEVAACRSWYQSEVNAMQPELIVAMGATAVRTVLGRTLPILANRGTLIELKDEFAPSARLLITVHPSYLLRVPPEARDAEYAKFIADLKVAAAHINAPPLS